MSLTPVGTPYTPYPTNPTGGVTPSTTYNPYGGTPVSSDTGTGSGFSTDFASISSMVAHGAGGGFSSYKLGAQMGQNMKGMFGNGFKGFIGGAKNVAITGVKGAGLSALVSAGVSAISNGVGVATGKVDGSKAVSNVIGDTIGGAVGGLGAVTLGGLGNLALGAFGVAGLPLTIATVGLGAVGGVLAGKMTKGLTDSF
jgi:hypothetical protein